jgi:hypothetical protein
MILYRGFLKHPSGSTAWPPYPIDSQGQLWAELLIPNQEAGEQRRMIRHRSLEKHRSAMSAKVNPPCRVRSPLPGSQAWIGR